jgi:hypothetical protein
VGTRPHRWRTTVVGEGFKPSRPPFPFGGLIMWLPLSLTTHGNNHDKKINPAIFQIPPRNRPSRFVLPPARHSVRRVRRFIITKMTTREGLKSSPTTTVTRLPWQFPFVPCRCQPPFQRVVATGSQPPFQRGCRRKAAGVCSPLSLPPARHSVRRVAFPLKCYQHESI